MFIRYLQCWRDKVEPFWPMKSVPLRNRCMLLTGQPKCSPTYTAPLQLGGVMWPTVADGLWPEVTYESRCTPGFQDGIIHTSEREETQWILKLKSKQGSCQARYWCGIPPLKGIVGAFQNCYYQYYKYVNMKKGSILWGVVLRCWKLTRFDSCLSYKELLCERLCNCHQREKEWRELLWIPDHDLHCTGTPPWGTWSLLNSFISSLRINAPQNMTGMYF